MTFLELAHRPNDGLAVALVRDQRRLTTCLSCGCRIAPSLAVAGSLRCHDCRDEHAPLQPELVEPRRGLLKAA